MLRREKAVPNGRSDGIGRLKTGTRTPLDLPSIGLNTRDWVISMDHLNPIMSTISDPGVQEKLKGRIPTISLFPNFRTEQALS